MAGSYYLQGLGNQYQPLSISAQGTPINIMSGAASGGTPSWQDPASASIPSVAQNSNSATGASADNAWNNVPVGMLTGQAPNQDAYGAINASPDWLQNYYSSHLLQEGQQGYYAPQLQMRDLQAQMAPQVQNLYQQQGENFGDPFWYQKGLTSFDPFAYAQGDYSGVHLNNQDIGKLGGFPAITGNNGTYSNRDNNPNEQALINPWSGQGWGYLKHPNQNPYSYYTGMQSGPQYNGPNLDLQNAYDPYSNAAWDPNMVGGKY